MVRVKEPENGHKGKLWWTCANESCIELKRSIISELPYQFMTDSIAKLIERR